MLIPISQLGGGVCFRAPHAFVDRHGMSTCFSTTQLKPLQTSLVKVSAG